MGVGWILLIVGGYFIGALSPSYWLTKTMHGTDIRQQGSGNPGATNAIRVLGRGLGLFILFFDVAKGILAALLPSWWGYSSPLWTLCIGGSAVLGHMFSPFLGFKGGKGAATTLGVISVLDGIMAGASFGIALLLIACTRYVSLGVLVTLASLPILAWLRDYDGAVIAAVFVIAGLGWFRHKTNLVNLLQGKERRLQWNG